MTNPLTLIEQADKEYSEKFDWKASKNPVVELSGPCYNLIVNSLVGLSLGSVLADRTSNKAPANTLSSILRHQDGFSLSLISPRSVGRWSLVSTYPDRHEPLKVFPFPYLFFNELLHLVLLYYSNLTRISQNCVVKSREMVAILSHKIGTTLSKSVYATLNRATPLTRSGVMSG